MKRFTLLFSAAALCITPMLAQVTTDIQVDSLEGFQLDLALAQTGESHDPAEAENQIRLAKRNYIDNKYHLGRYSPNYSSKIVNGNGSVQVACSNVDFETGDFTSWNGAIGDNMTSSSSPFSNQVSGFFSTTNDAPITDMNARHTIITTAYGNDPYGGFPGVPSGSGNYTVRMGGQTPNYQGEIMEQTFTVSPTSTSFAYRYAVVLNDPQSGHSFSAKPYFKIEVLDQNGNPISPCTQLFVVADTSSLAGFTLSPLSPPTGGVAYYKPWTTVNFDLSGYVNQNITVRFTVAGCTQSGHFGYCYFDCSCSTLAANVNFCPGNTFLFLNAPEGYGSYQWLDPNHTPIPGATNDTLLVNNPNVGDTFYVYLVSQVDTSCHNTLPVVLEYTQIYTNATSTDMSCYGVNDGTATATGTMGFPPYTYIWSTTPPQTAQSISNLGAGNYIVHMLDSLGCESFDTVTVNSPARLDTSLIFYSFCPGDPNITLTAPLGFSSYTWIGPNGDTLPNGVPSNTTVVTGPQISQEYTCILWAPPACPIYDSIILDLNPPFSFFNPDSTVNVFTPNGDLKNDRFYPYFDYSVSRQTSSGGVPEYDFAALYINTYEIWIYDRWGNEVFYSNDYTQGWDGKVKGDKECTDGVYFWVASMTSRCKVDQTPVVSKGFVHLMR